MADQNATIKRKNSNGTFDNIYPKTKASNVSGLATVATSGSYTDLSNKPSIPDAYSKTETDALLGNKLDKATGVSKLYGNSNQGIPTTFDISSSPKNWGVPQYDGNGQLTVKETPSANTDATSKKYVDDGLGNKLDKTSAVDLILSNGGTGDSPRIYFTKGAAWDSDPDWYIYQSGSGLVFGCRKDSEYLQNIIVNSAGNMTFRGTSPQLDFCITPSNYRNYITRSSDRLRIARDAGGWMKLLDIMDSGTFIPSNGANLGSSSYKFGTLYLNYLSDGANTVSVSSLIQLVCLLEGTKIKMADGTEKPIEEVQAGDIVMSYNPKTKEKVSAVVFDNRETGADTANLKEALFIDEEKKEEKSLLIFRDHGVYKLHSDDDPLSEGHGTGICSWHCDSLGKDQALSIDNRPLTFVGLDEFDNPTPVKHYNLLTSNIYYYADGILCAGSQWTQVRDLMASYREVLELDENADLKARVETLNEQVEALRPKYTSQKEENSKRKDLRLTKEARRKFVRRTLLIREIEGYKRQLNDLDVINEKHYEGLLTDEEWESIKAEKAEIRRKIAAIKEEIRNGDINKHGTAEYEKAMKAYRDEVDLLTANRSLFEEVLEAKRVSTSDELVNELKNC